MDMEKMVNELGIVYNFIEEHKDVLVALSVETFLPCICMLMEEYCKANDYDMVEKMKECLLAAEQVNAELGAY